MCDWVSITEKLISLSTQNSRASNFDENDCSETPNRSCSSAFFDNCQHDTGCWFQTNETNENFNGSFLAINVSNSTMTNDDSIKLIRNDVRPLPSLVKFRDLLPIYGFGEDIFVAVEFAEGFPGSLGDWIGLFPAGWTQLDQFVGYQKAPQPAKKQLLGHHFLYSFVFKTKAIQILSCQGLHQFVYVSQTFGAVLGVSSTFCLDPNANCLRYTSDAINMFKKSTAHLSISDEYVLSKRHTDQQYVLATKNQTIVSQKVSSSLYAKSLFDEEMLGNYKFNIITERNPTEIISPMKRPAITEIENRHNNVELLDKVKLVTSFNMGYFQNQMGEMEHVINLQQRENGNLRRNLKRSTEYNLRLLSEIEILMEQLQITEDQLDKTSFHVQNIYYTLYQSGFDRLYLRNGECVELKDFQGILLHLEPLHNKAQPSKNNK